MTNSKEAFQEAPAGQADQADQAGQADQERLRRWRLVLGRQAEEAAGAGGLGSGPTGAAGTGPTRLSADDLRIDQALEALYDSPRAGGLGPSCPRVNRWLGDIRRYFPAQVVQVLQRDALQRLDLKRLLLEPELLKSVEPNVHLVGTLLALKNILPEKTRQTAGQVVRRVVQQIQRQLKHRLVQDIRGSLQRASRTNRPRPNEIDWPKTILKNLRHYQPELGTVIPERLVGYARQRKGLQDVVLCLDQSGSMAASLVYAGVLGAVLASLPSVQTQLVVFDTEVVDLTDQLTDPVELLLGVQLGGGTDINRAVAYCQGLIQRPNQTIFLVLSDFYEGGMQQELLRRMATLIRSGVQVIALLALSDEGIPAYNHELAAQLAAMGAAALACTPQAFGGLLAAAIRRQDVSLWAAQQGFVTVRGSC